MTLGMFEKIVLADTLLATSADAVFGYAGPLKSLDAWTGVLAFSGQIFFDFAGYSTCAIGAALCLGFHLKDNFRFPYAAVGFSDFWRRWHISLSTFLRDFLYIPLGGNRRGPARAAVNLLIVMFIGEIWLGAAWTFVILGVIHGVFVMIERIFKAVTGDAVFSHTLVRRLLLGLGTYAVVCFAWVFFRASTFTGCGQDPKVDGGCGPQRGRDPANPGDARGRRRHRRPPGGALDDALDPPGGGGRAHAAHARRHGLDPRCFRQSSSPRAAAMHSSISSFERTIPQPARGAG